MLHSKYCNDSSASIYPQAVNPAITKTMTAMAQSMKWLWVNPSFTWIRMAMVSKIPLPDQCLFYANGYVEATDCNDSTSNAYPGSVEVCNGIDDDCMVRRMKMVLTVHFLRR